MVKLNVARKNYKKRFKRSAQLIHDAKEISLSIKNKQNSKIISVSASNLILLRPSL